MRCQDIMELLSPYLDGAVTAEELEAVRVHVACCPRCSAELEELRACIGMLKELPLVAPPVDFRAGLMEKLDQLSTPQGSTKKTNFFDRITGIAKSSWYRAAAVAAVMVMAIGITSLWEKEGNFPPLDQQSPEVIVVHEPQEGQENTEINEQQPSPESQSNEPGSSSGAVPNSQAKQPAQQESISTPVINQATTKQEESYVPQPSEGLAAVSATIKLDVAGIEDTLKAIDSLTQANGGTIYQPYSGTQDSGLVGIKISRQNYEQVIGALKKLGSVISYLPTEKDLSVQHQTAKAELERLKAEQEVLLQSKLTNETNQEWENQLKEVNQALLKQIEVMKLLEERANYCLINIHLQ
ncbi:zf-HC2 domain-containing protein [Desulforamulus ferrireducens]|uniref:Anti-sigma-W factor RsiW n=1 Tax=Desulforamulus ferrireducens TaxID=1833852 RepID=A0A1S6IY60_9FIRM|nr:zf-HC2 domain-containing protein [Desulforamulus ferrireducens]AQS59696.1 hypothetical protein B0537_11770 [Desulforamulus ferrireducens]